MLFTINRCQAGLSELLTLLAPRNEGGSDSLGQALCACEHMLADAIKYRPVWTVVAPIQYKLEDAEAGSIAFDRFTERFRKAGYADAEDMACSVLMDSALTAIRVSKLSLAQLNREIQAEASSPHRSS